MSELKSPLEERVVATVREGRDEIVSLVSELVAFDTTAREAEDPPHDEEALQRHLQARLAAIGAETDLWEPTATEKDGRHLPSQMSFTGRPQLAAHLRGAGGGRSLLLNGHIDAVSAEPRKLWATDPFHAVERDGRLYGRGTCDMKGGIAGMLYALEVLHRLGVKLAGDALFCTVTDEESSGAGGFAAVARGVKADAGICAEPTSFDAWVACRGSLTPVVTVEGRAGHAEMAQPHWREGGAVNAISKAQLVLEAMERLQQEWLTRADQKHPLLSPGTIVPTIIKGGEWSVTYPSSCEVTFEVMYLPGHVDAAGTGKPIEDEILHAVNAAADADSWLAEHPLQWFWDGDVVPAEVPADHPLVGLCLETGAALGRPGRPAGLDSWHDGATFTRRGGTPTFSYGPGDGSAAHTINEWVEVDQLVDFAAAAALILMRWCGVA